MNKAEINLTDPRNNISLFDQANAAILVLQTMDNAFGNGEKDYGNARIVLAAAIRDAFALGMKHQELITPKSPKQ